MHWGVLANPDSWYLRDLARAAKARGDIVTGLPFTELSASIDREGNCRVWAGARALDEFHAVLMRTMPPGSLEQVVFRMDALAQHERQGGVVVNPAKSIETAVDKYLTSARLSRAGLRSPATIVCQTSEAAMAAMEQLGNDVVIKPLFGGEGRGITRVTDRDVGFRVFRALCQVNAVLYLQEYIPHEGCDLRLFVLGQTVYGMRRCNSSDWRTNISRGAHAEALVPDDHLREIALRAARSVDTQIAGVDVLRGQSGEFFVLEVNAVPGWQALSRVLGKDIASEVLNYISTLVPEEAGP